MEGRGLGLRGGGYRGGGGGQVFRLLRTVPEITNRFRLQLYNYSTASTANMNVTILNNISIINLAEYRSYHMFIFRLVIVDLLSLVHSESLGDHRALFRRILKHCQSLHEYLQPYAIILSYTCYSTTATDLLFQEVARMGLCTGTWF